VLTGLIAGAGTTVSVLQQTPLNSSLASRIKAVVFIGNNLHSPNLTCNVVGRAVGIDGNVGLMADWGNSGRLLDICYYSADLGVDTDCFNSGSSIPSLSHLLYQFSSGTQKLGLEFLLSKLSGQ